MQDIDLSGFPDQPKPAAAKPGPAGGVDLAAFPDQPGQPPKPTPGFLGDVKKPAAIKPPETFGHAVTRNVHAVGKVMYDALPDVAGATGAMLGAEGGLLAGPPGAAMGGVVGAGAGGMLGRYGQMLIDVARGKKPPQTTPDGKPVDQEARVAGEVGKAANRQMLYQMGGEILAAPLGFLRRGGFITKTPEIADTQAANAAYGTNLSGPEIASGSRAGNIAKGIQTYTGGSFVGGEIQREAREKGAANATKELEQAIRTIGTPTTKTEAGRAAEAGIGGAKAGLVTRGHDIDRVIDSAPPLDVTKIKQEAVDVFVKDVLPILKDYPDLSGKAKAIIRQAANDPTLIQRNPRPVMTAIADAVLEKTNSPLVKMIRTLIDTNDQVSFKAATQMRTRLRSLGKQPDDLMAGAAKGIASHFENVFTDELFKASPAYQKASSTYGVGARLLKSQAIDTIFKASLKEPGAVVGMIDTPTKAKNLKRALVGLASQGPDAKRARAAYDVIRSTLWTENIIKGGKEGAVDLPGMAGRIRQNAETLGVLFGDKQGQQVLEHGKAIAKLFEKQTPIMTGNFRKMMEIGRLAAGAISLATFHGGTGLTLGAVWEGFPDFFTWVIHDPKATKWFIDGVQAENPRNLTTNTIRLFEAYRKAHAEAQAAAGRKPAAAQGTP